MQEIFDKIV